MLEYEMQTGTKVIANPFPHFQVGNVLSENWLSKISEHWPSPDHFSLEGHSQHSSRCHIAHSAFHGDDCAVDREASVLFKLDSVDREVWSDFIKGPLQAMAEECVSRMAPVLDCTRGEFGRELYFDRLWLDDAPPHYQEHGLRIHTHYDHDPFWALTGVLYLDDGDDGVPGTFLARHPDFDGEISDDRISEIVLNSRRWYQDERFIVEAEVAMKRNSMLVMADGPASFHGVRPFTGRSAHNVFRRRTILFHLCLHPGNCRQLFGLSREEFFGAAQRGEVDKALGDAVAADTRAFLWASKDSIGKDPRAEGFSVRPILN